MSTVHFAQVMERSEKNRDILLSFLSNNLPGRLKEQSLERSHGNDKHGCRSKYSQLKMIQRIACFLRFKTMIYYLILSSEKADFVNFVKIKTTTNRKVTNLEKLLSLSLYTLLKRNKRNLKKVRMK